jgi:hypothetical protein
LDSGVQWIRRRQHRLARAVLGLFFAAWLQAAVMPCVMASVPEDVRALRAAGSMDASAGTAGQDMHDGCGGSAAGAGEETVAVTGGDPADADVHCPYCPPGEQPSDHGSCDTRAACAYPHDPQVDARSAIASLPALPVAYLTPSLVPVLIARDAGRDAPEVVPRVRLPVSFCRLIE